MKYFSYLDFSSYLLLRPEVTTTKHQRKAIYEWMTTQFFVVQHHNVFKVTPSHPPRHSVKQQHPGSRPSGYNCLIGTYHDKIHIAMEYLTIFRSPIVYSMGAYKALSIIAINYLCIRQIPRNQTATKSNTLPVQMIHRY